MLSKSSTSLYPGMKRFKKRVLKMDLPSPFILTSANLGTFSSRTNWAGRLRTSIGISVVIVYSFSLITNNHNKNANPAAPKRIDRFCHRKKEYIFFLYSFIFI